MQSNAKPAALRSNRRQPLAEFVRARDGRMVTMKTPIKAKARTNVRAFGKLEGVEMPRDCNLDDSLVLFGLLFRRRQALEALQKLFLGHALYGDLGVIGIDAGARRPDQGHGIGFRLVHFDEFLQ